jgi:hypothetical protein
LTVYVDSARIPATVGGHRSRWSHLTADTIEELTAFGARIGLKAVWFQTCKRKCGPTDGCVHWHYDVTDPKRAEAVAAGAVEIDMRQLGIIISARRAAARAEAAS